MQNLPGLLGKLPPADGTLPARCRAAFEWVSPSYKSKNYSHWGVDTAYNLVEPNNLKKDEYCAVANSSQMMPGGAFGWSDEWCNITSAFMCKVQSEWRGPQARPAWEGAALFLAAAGAGSCSARW